MRAKKEKVTVYAIARCASCLMLLTPAQGRDPASFVCRHCNSKEFELADMNDGLCRYDDENLKSHAGKIKE